MPREALCCLLWPYPCFLSLFLWLYAPSCPLACCMRVSCAVSVPFLVFPPSFSISCPSCMPCRDFSRLSTPDLSACLSASLCDAGLPFRRTFSLPIGQIFPPYTFHSLLRGTFISALFFLFLVSIWDRRCSPYPIATADCAMYVRILTRFHELGTEVGQ
ncbi:hypothetical protein CPC08DRAFT_264947 [Agrocybe pediades]|nr:hypothetical protein CPC08DRAFT_264947 [Agrocybe pediades]